MVSTKHADRGFGGGYGAGGVGLLTRAMLAHNVVEAARWRECR